jgi:hypothetical protein
LPGNHRVPPNLCPHGPEKPAGADADPAGQIVP